MTVQELIIALQDLDRPTLTVYVGHQDCPRCVPSASFDIIIVVESDDEYLVLGEQE